VTARVAGIDGWRRGWVAVVLQGGAVESVIGRRDLAGCVAALGDVTVVGVDIPIGLPEMPPRTADLEAKRRLGRRASTVFMTPSRAVLAEPSYAAARAHARDLGHPGPSAQAYGLRRRIFEAEALAAADPRLCEVHPELSFLEMAGRPLPPKASPQGQQARRLALAAVGYPVPLDLASVVPVADVIDATAVAWSADRISRGAARSLPDPPQRDPSGREMAIWY
jgi:predicted RNase H-like nuclease